MIYRLSVLALCCVGGVLPAQEKAAVPSVQPIAVVTLSRKEPVLFDKDIEPILAGKCYVCHSGNITKGDLDMGSYESLMKGGKNGPALVPGKASESLLVKLAGKTQKPMMPPKMEEPLTPPELALIKLWIDQGAKAPTTRKQKAAIVLRALPASVHPVRALALSADRDGSPAQLGAALTMFVQRQPLGFLASSSYFLQYPNKLLASGRAGQIHLYDPVTGKFVRSLVDPALESKSAHASVVESLAFSPDGKMLASGGFQEVALWDPNTGKLIRKLTGFAERVVALSFSPSGKWLATGGGAPTEEGELKVFEIPQGKLLLDLKNAHSDTVFGVSFSPDSTKLASCAADKFVRVFEVPAGKLDKSFEGHTHHVLDVAWRGDGKFLASAGADNVIKVWDYEKGEQARTVGNYTKQVTRLAFKGKTSDVLACSGDKVARFWNTDNGGAGTIFGSNKDFLYAVCVSSDGKSVAVGGEEGVVRLYNGANGSLVKELLPPGVAAPATK